MGIGLTEEHRALADSVRGLTTRTADHAVLAALAGQGVLGLHLPEPAGGQGYGLLELCVALEVLGERRVSGAYLPTVIASAALSGHHGAARDLLGGLADGSRTAAVALGGTAPAVLAIGSAGADLFLVPVDGGWALLDRDDVAAEPVEGVDLDRELCSVAPLSVPGDRELGPVPVRELAAVLLGAEACGIAQWAVSTAADYAKVREQFGRPIGQFQGVKHRVAAALVTLEQARAATWDAARALDTSPPPTDPAPAAPPAPLAPPAPPAATAATAALSTARFSSAVNELFSPTVPSSTKPCTPSRTSAACTDCVAARSRFPSASN